MLFAELLYYYAGKHADLGLKIYFRLHDIIYITKLGIRDHMLLVQVQVLRVEHVSWNGVGWNITQAYETPIKCWLFPERFLQKKKL